MSSVYVLEPPTKGKVVLTTTAGPLDIELWPKEARKAVRNFVQLCVDGYYDGTIFHRVIKSFMVQGGDPTGSGTGGDTVYGEPFSDEFHSRLRFNHRGLVACANAGSPNSNNSQFFLTLDRCDWLDKKHTIFGKVTGDTIYNLIQLGDVETGEDDRPLDPPKVISVEVLWNPFDDVVPRRIAKSVEATPGDDAALKNRKKAKKELNLLSFGEEAEEEEQQLAAVKEKKIKSSHDVLEDPRLLKSASDASKMDSAEAKRREDPETSRLALDTASKLPSKLSSGRATDGQRDATAGGSGSDDDETNFDNRMRKQIMEKRMKHMEGAKPREKISKQAKVTADRRESSPPRRSNRDEDEEEDEDEDKAEKKEKLKLKKKGLGSTARAELAEKAELDIELLSPLEQQRMKYKQRKRTLLGREEETLARLARFNKALTNTKDVTLSPTDPQRKEDEDEADWLAHSLKFGKDSSKQNDMERSDDPNQYVVLDPLLEKGKEKFNIQQAKMKRRNRSWAGNSVT